MEHKKTTFVCCTALIGQLVAGAALADSSPILTSPADGTWVDISQWIEFAGDAPTPGSVELQIMNLSSGEWEHSYDVETSAEGFVNDLGEVRYHFSKNLNTGPGGPTPGYHEPGVTRDDGQRSNAMYFTVAGWGDTPMREPGHYVTTYQVCGRDAQQCCIQPSDACDSGLECVRSCDGPQCGHDVCAPKQDPPPPPPPKQDPPPPPSDPTPSPPPSPVGDFDGDGCEVAGTGAPMHRSQNSCAGAGASIVHGLFAFSINVTSGTTVNLTLQCADGAIGNFSNVGPGSYNQACANAAPYKSYCGTNPVCAMRQN